MLGFGACPSSYPDKTGKKTSILETDSFEPFFLPPILKKKTLASRADLIASTTVYTALRMVLPDSRGVTFPDEIPIGTLNLDFLV